MNLLPAVPSALRVLSISRLAAGGRWRVEAMRAFDEPVLYWFTRGQGRITVQGQTRGYGPHNAVFLPPGAMHGFEVSPQVFGSAVFFGRGSTLPLPTESRHLRIRDTQPQTELTQIIDALAREIEAARPGHRRAAESWAGLVSVWLERQEIQHAGDERGPDASGRLAQRYTDLLEQGFREGMSIADYAEALGVTPTHLTRACRSASGRSAHDLLQDRRLFEARRLLLDTREPVARVSAGSGFASPAYFTRAFRRSTGKSPTDFRRG